MFTSHFVTGNGDTWLRSLKIETMGPSYLIALLSIITGFRKEITCFEEISQKILARLKETLPDDYYDELLKDFELDLKA